MRTETRWPGFAADAGYRNILSLLSVPLPAQGSVTGALNIYGKAAAAFDDDAAAVAAALASYAVVALLNVRVLSSAVREAEAIKRAMVTRAVIEQSKGIPCPGMRARPSSVRDARAPVADTQRQAARHRRRGRRVDFHRRLTSGCRARCGLSAAVNVGDPPDHHPAWANVHGCRVDVTSRGAKRPSAAGREVSLTLFGSDNPTVVGESYSGGFPSKIKCSKRVQREPHPPA